MHIVFGWELDGSCHPQTANGAAAAIGQPVVGPNGLLDILESTLGLLGPNTPAAVRIARYQERLRSLNDGSRFYSRSFARDAWATAKQILAWRDELYASGWQGQPIESAGERLETMASIEMTAGQPLGNSRGERLHAVLEVLTKEHELPIERIDVVPSEEWLPTMWRRLLARLRATGITIRILTRADGTSVLTLPTIDGETQVSVDGQAFTMVVQSAGLPPAAAAHDKAATVAWFAPLSLSGEPPKFPPARLSPSTAAHDGNDNRPPVAETPIEIGQRLPLSGTPDMRLLGEAVHGFLAADNIDRPIAEREAMAKEALDRWGVGGALLPASLIEASKRLDRFIADRWPSARQHRELPVFSRIGDQRASGRIDLLLETAEGFVIIDHKTFPGAPDTWVEKAKEFTPQLSLYSQMIAHATGRPVLQNFIHMPIVGVVIGIGLKFWPAIQAGQA